MLWALPQHLIICAIILVRGEAGNVWDMSLWLVLVATPCPIKHPFPGEFGPPSHSST